MEDEGEDNSGSGSSSVSSDDDMVERYGLKKVGQIQGHESPVLGIRAGEVDFGGTENEEFVISGEENSKVIIWKLNDRPDEDELSDIDDFEWGVPKNNLQDHEGAVNDVGLTHDFASGVTASSDGKLMKRFIKDGSMETIFEEHKECVISGSISKDNELIVTLSRDNVIMLWHSNGQLKDTFDRNPHNGEITSVRFGKAERGDDTFFISSSLDGSIKFWYANDLSLKLELSTFDPINCFDTPPVSNYLIGGHTTGRISIWNYAERTHLRSFTVDAEINDIRFNHKDYGVVAATSQGVYIWDLVRDSNTAQGRHYVEEDSEDRPLVCHSICWSHNAKNVYAGFSDGVIRVYECSKKWIYEEG